MESKQFIIVVEDCPDKRAQFRQAFGKRDDIQVHIENSIFDACCKWLLFHEMELVPRAVITSWHFCEEDACITDPRDGKFKSGAHFLLMQCAKLTQDGLLIVYTDTPKSAKQGLAGSIEEDRAIVLSSKEMTVVDLILWIEKQNTKTHAR